jgi:hypothetical protein
MREIVIFFFSCFQGNMAKQQAIFPPKRKQNAIAVSSRLKPLRQHPKWEGPKTRQKAHCIPQSLASYQVKDYNTTKIATFPIPLSDTKNWCWPVAIRIHLAVERKATRLTSIVSLLTEMALKRTRARLLPPAGVGSRHLLLGAHGAPLLVVG